MNNYKDKYYKYNNKLKQKIIEIYQNKEKLDNILSKYSDFLKFQDKKKNEDVFIELCFCLLTANYNAKKAIEIQDNIGLGFITMSLEQLKNRLKQLGYRYPNKRAEYIYEARKYKDDIKDIIFNNKLRKEDRRLFLVNNIKGLGFKESSHFLRNIGFIDYSIIDFHIIDILFNNNMIDKPTSKTLTKNKYLEIEKILKEFSDSFDDKYEMNLSKLDIFLWYIETNTIMK